MVMIEARVTVRIRASQVRAGQIKPSQAKPSQATSNQVTWGAPVEKLVQIGSRPASEEVKVGGMRELTVSGAQPDGAAKYEFIQQAPEPPEIVGHTRLGTSGTVVGGREAGGRVADGRVAGGRVADGRVVGGQCKSVQS